MNRRGASPAPKLASFQFLRHANKQAQNVATAAAGIAAMPPNNRRGNRRPAKTSRSSTIEGYQLDPVARAPKMGSPMKAVYLGRFAPLRDEPAALEPRAGLASGGQSTVPERRGSQAPA